MKNLFRLFFCLLTFNLLLVSCKKDSDNSPKSYIKHGDVEYELSQSIVQKNFGKYYASESNSMGLVLLSPGFKIHDVSGRIDSISGIGHGISFDIQTSGSDKLDIGDYVYNEESGKSGTFSHSTAVVNYDSQLEDGKEFEVSGGKLTVKMNGSNYELTFDCVDTDGKVVSGYYRGTLKYYNLDDGTKSSKIKSIWH